MLGEDCESVVSLTPKEELAVGVTGCVSTSSQLSTPKSWLYVLPLPGALNPKPYKP